MSRPRELAGSFQPAAPSVASSSTSEYSRRLEADRASSSRPASSIDSRNYGHNAPDDGYSGSTQVGVRLEDALVDQRDFAQKRQSKVRRSGGFLLESALPSIRKRAGHRKDKKGAEISTSFSAKESQASPTKLYTRHTTQDNGGHQTTSHTQEMAQQKADETGKAARAGSNRMRDVTTQDVTHEESRITGANSNDRLSTASDDDKWTHDTIQPHAIDPAQIVNMALNLSESRRRHLSMGQLPSQPISTGRRVLSVAGANVTAMQGSYNAGHTGNSLKQALQQQRRSSRNLSPNTGHSSPTSRRPAGPHEGISQGALFLPFQQHDVQHRFSDATLTRAEKARKYFELAAEYRRLLQLLPPTTSTGRSSAQARADLDRDYNPLQAIRNRKVRTRERRPLPVISEEFDDQYRAKAWIDAVQQNLSRHRYATHDGVELPTYEGTSEQVLPKDASTHAQLPKRPRSDWSISPSELLADAYWLEQVGNKSVIVNHQGNKIFSQERPVTAARPRLSAELSRELERLSGHFSDNRDTPANGSYTGEDSDAHSERGRRRRLHFGDKHGFHLPRPRSRASSGSSSSDEEAALRDRLQPKRTGTDDLNVGPLNRHLQKLLVEEANRPGTLPSLESPNRWESGHIARTGECVPERPFSKDGSAVNGSLGAPETKRPTLLRSPTSFGGSERNHAFEFPRSSLDDLSTAPSSPMAMNFNRPIPGSDREQSPPASPRVRHGRSKLGMFRSRTNLREPDGSESYEDPDELSKSRQASGEKEANDAGSGTRFVPNLGKKLFPHKRNESYHTFNARSASKERIEFKDRKDSNEPPSAVSRFFKGVGHSGTKMGDIIMRKDRGGGDSDSVSDGSSDELSENDKSRREALKKRPAPVRRATTLDSLGSITSKAGRTKHFNLPTFRPANAPQEEEETASTIGEDSDRALNDRAQKLRLDQRGFSTRATADSNLSRIISGEAVDDSSRSQSRTRSRLDRVLDEPGGVGRGGLPITSLAHQSTSPGRSQRSVSRPTLSDKRHWSITDHRLRSSQMSKDAIVKPTDIARTGALLICSGIKARSIWERAHSVHPEPAPFLIAALRSTGLDDGAASNKCPRVPRKEEHVLAARILSRDIESSFSSLRKSIDHFRDTISADLHKQLAGLRDLLADDLTPQIKACSDDADLYAKKLSQNYPLETKNIYERARIILRNRHRRGRWLRRGGWAAVEYIVLGFMWWAWFVVLVFRFFRGIIIGSVSAMRWLFWL